jgi:hypothetical protein
MSFIRLQSNQDRSKAINMENNNMLMPLVNAVEAATGIRPHKSTAIRWVVRGVSGVRLEAKRLGSRYMTTVEDVKAFIERATASSKPEIPFSPPPGYRPERIEKAKEAYERLKPRGSTRRRDG